MQEAGLEFLKTALGQDALHEASEGLAGADAHLGIASRLRRRLDQEQVQAVIETALLREKAARKFSLASEMYFTRDGLEQATAEVVARYRASRFSAAGMALVADLGCGIGGDSLALAALATVVALDISRLNLLLAQANASAYDVAERLLSVQADLLELRPLAVQAFFFDPARRTASGSRVPPARRLRGVEHYRPPLSVVDNWLRVVPSGAVKVSPAIDYEEIPVAAEIEFVSLQGELKEGILWFGDLHSGAVRRATCLPAGMSLSSRDAVEDPATKVGLAPPRAVLYEPDVAIIRAHLVRHLALTLNATLLDPSIAYLTADTIQPTPFARAFLVEDTFPFQLKRLRHYLREHDVGRVVIKKRGSPLDPDDLRQALRLRGSKERIVFLTQVSGEPAVIIARPADQ